MISRIGLISVAVCDPFPLVRFGIEQLIESQADMTFWGGAGNASEAITLLDEPNPQVMLIEPLIPNAAGFELIRDLLKRQPMLKLLAYTRLDEKTNAERCVELGARGFVSKAAPLPTLLLAIRRIQSGNMHLSNDVGLIRLARMSGNKVPTHPIERLSPHEFQVFHLIAEGMGTVQIAATLGRSIKTIETYRARIKIKLNVATSLELSQYAVRNLTH